MPMAAKPKPAKSVTLTQKIRAKFCPILMKIEKLWNDIITFSSKTNSMSWYSVTWRVSMWWRHATITPIGVWLPWKSSDGDFQLWRAECVYIRCVCCLKWIRFWSLDIELCFIRTYIYEYEYEYVFEHHQQLGDDEIYFDRLSTEFTCEINGRCGNNYNSLGMYFRQTSKEKQLKLHVLVENFVQTFEHSLALMSGVC